MLVLNLSTFDVREMLLADSNANWSYEGAAILADYLLDLSDMNEQPTEFDVVAVRCEWSEYSEGDLVDSYGYKVGGNYALYPEDFIGDLVEELSSETICVEFKSGGENKFLVLDI